MPSSTIVAQQRGLGVRRVSTTARAHRDGALLDEHRANRVAKLFLISAEFEFHEEALRLTGSFTSATNARRSIFSPAVSGSSARTASASGSLYAATCGPANARSSSRVGTLAGSRDDHDGHADLTHDVVGAGHDRERGEVGVGREHALDLNGIHVVTAAYVHLLAAPDEPEPAAVVDPTEIAGAHEAVGGERGGGLLGVVPVARHHRVGAQAHLADLARRDRAILGVEHAELDARVRAPDAHDCILFGIVERGAEADAGFGARITRREQRAEAAARLLGQARCDRSAARDDVADARQVVRVEVGLAQHERELRRDAGNGRHLLAREELERVARAPALHDERRAAAPQAARQLGHEAEMRERRAAERPAAAVPRVADVGLRDERELPVAVARALRNSRRARGEDDRDRAVGIIGERGEVVRRSPQARASRPTSVVGGRHLDHTRPVRLFVDEAGR